MQSKKIDQSQTTGGFLARRSLQYLDKNTFSDLIFLVAKSPTTTPIGKYKTPPLFPTGTIEIGTTGGLPLLRGVPAAPASIYFVTLMPSIPARTPSFGTATSVQSPIANTLPAPGASFTSRVSFAPVW